MEKPIANQTELTQIPLEVVDDVKVIGRLAKWYRVMREAGLTFDDLQTPITDAAMRKRLIQNWQAGAPVIAVAMPQDSPKPQQAVTINVEHLICDMFIPPAKQLELVHRWNIERSWGFIDAEFTALNEPPAWPKGKLSCVILEVSLDTVEMTFNEAWHLIIAAQRGNHWPCTKFESLRLLLGITHQRGLKWRVVDLVAYWDHERGIRPMDVRSPEKSPHSAILWAGAFFPRWVQGMDGITVPYVWIPGYEASVGGCKPWSHMPNLSFGCSDYKVRLLTDSCNRCRQDGDWAVPEFQD